MSNDTDTSGGNKPITPNDFRDLASVIDIFRTLGRVTVLEDTTRSHAEKIEQLMQWGSAIPHIEKDVAQNTKDLNALGSRHTKELNDLGQRLDKNVNELEKQQTNALNSLGIRLGKEITDLKNIAHTTKILGYIALTLAGVIATALVAYHYR